VNAEARSWSSLRGRIESAWEIPLTVTERGASHVFRRRHDDPVLKKLEAEREAALGADHAAPLRDRCAGREV